jgi:putative transposase
MARKARVQYPGAVYHVMDRGDRREAIFCDDDDRERFMVTLGQACERTGWRVHAFVLIGNHYQFMLETPCANLVEGMSWFQTTVTARYNRRHKLTGHLFQGRYEAVLVDPEERGYFATLSDYIHLNPVRARLVGLDERLFDYRWSSYPLYVARQGRPGWFEPRVVMEELGFADTSAGRRGFAQRMRIRAVSELEGKESPAVAELRRGWCLGGAGFRERMLSLLDACQDRLSKRRRDASVERDHGIDEARRILELGLRYFGLDAASLSQLAKGDERKAAIAALIDSRTTVPNAWRGSPAARAHEPSQPERSVGEGRFPPSGARKGDRTLSEIEIIALTPHASIRPDFRIQLLTIVAWTYLRETFR